MQTLGTHYACVVPLIDGLGYEYAFTRGRHTSSSRRVWHGLATQVDSMHESMHALSCGLQGTQSKWIGRGKPVWLCILAFSLVFTAYISNAVVSFSVVLKPLVSLMGRLVACSARIAEQTDRPSSVTPAVHARRGLMSTDNRSTVNTTCILSSMIDGKCSSPTLVEISDTSLPPLSRHVLLSFQVSCPKWGTRLWKALKRKTLSAFETLS